MAKISTQIELDPPCKAIPRPFVVACTQKLHLPRRYITFPAGSLVICKLRTSGRRFICEAFPLPDYQPSDAVCHLDDCVEIVEHPTNRLTRFDSTVNGIELVSEPGGRYENVQVQVFLSESIVRQRIVRSKESLTKAVRDFLRFFVFGRSCLISLAGFEENYGIERVFVEETAGKDGFGRISSDSKVTISQIRFLTLHPGRLIGCEKALNELNELVLRKSTSQALIVGPPGSGKTSVIRSVAAEQNCLLLPLTSQDIVASYPGEAERSLRRRFQEANEFFSWSRSKVVLFVKDVELLCPKETAKSHVSRASIQLMTLLDELTPGVVVFATTSSVESLDPKIRRPGRLENEIYLQMPDQIDRLEILRLFLGAQDLPPPEEELISAAERTSGFVPADLESFVAQVKRSRSQNATWTAAFDASLLKIRPSILRSSIGLVPDRSKGLEALGGMTKLKHTLRTAVLGPLRHPATFERFNLPPLKGILLYGPPGCAKTTIARCLAGETRMTFFSASAAEVYSPYVGSAERFIVRLFNQARASAPSIVFLDEIDALVGARSTSGASGRGDVHTRVLSTLLTEIDGIGATANATLKSKSSAVLVIGATNRPDLVDEALKRPGRFDRLIYIPAPDAAGRLEILKMCAARMSFDEDVDLGALSEATRCFSGADLVNLCNEAALCAATEDLDAKAVRQRHFDQVLAEIRPSLTAEQLEWYETFESSRQLNSIKRR